MTQNAEEQDNDPREAKRVVTETEEVVPSAPVQQTVEKTETTHRTETSEPRTSTPQSSNE